MRVERARKLSLTSSFHTEAQARSEELSHYLPRTSKNPTEEELLRPKHCVSSALLDLSTADILEQIILWGQGGAVLPLEEMYLRYP